MLLQIDLRFRVKSTCD